MTVEIVMKTDYIFAQIDTSAIRHNCDILKSCAVGLKFCAVVKANAYGHGVEIVVPTLLDYGVDMLAVATLNEARQLVDISVSVPVLVFGSELSIYRGREKQEIARWIVENQIRITAMSISDLAMLAAEASKAKRKAVVHLKFDSGMSRMGLDENDLLELLEFACANSDIFVEGIYTHLANADEADKSFANQQLTKFRSFIGKIKNMGYDIPLIHASNSAATVDMPDKDFNMIRPGISIYGYYAGEGMISQPSLKPAMRVVSFLTVVKQIPKGSFIGYGCSYQAKRDMTIGIVPIGYADGYARRLSNSGKMIFKGKIVSVVGRVSMDQTIIDLTDIVKEQISAQPGDEIIVIDNNRQSPNSIEAIAKEIGTISYDVLTNLGDRISRISI